MATTTPTASGIDSSKHYAITAAGVEATIPVAHMTPEQVYELHTATAEWYEREAERKAQRPSAEFRTFAELLDVVPEEVAKAMHEVATDIADYALNGKPPRGGYKGDLFTPASYHGVHGWEYREALQATAAEGRNRARATR